MKYIFLALSLFAIAPACAQPPYYGQRAYPYSYQRPYYGQQPYYVPQNYGYPYQQRFYPLPDPSPPSYYFGNRYQR